MLMVYLAGRYGRREELAGYAAELRAAGIGVTSRWLEGDHEMPLGDYDEMELRRFATEDLDDIDLAEVLVLFTEAPDAPGRRRGGRHVEFGYALALGITTVIVGPVENVFCVVASHRSESWRDALDYLVHELAGGLS